MGNFGDVREALQAKKAEEAWGAVLHELDPWFGREPIEVVIEYCKDHLDRWPGDVPTFAPRSWFKRELEVIEADPLTPLFTHALVGRADHWMSWAAELLEEHKALKPPKFMDVDAMGPMRWRTGEPLTEEQVRRLITYMRSHKEVGSEELERVRQLLNDEDAQRWSAAIHGAWVDAGEKSAHRWALFQVAAFGKRSDLSIDGDELEQMVSSGRHARAKQYMDIVASMGSPEGLSALGRFALYGSLSMSTRGHAVGALEPLARGRSMSVFEYIERVLDVHAPLSWEPSEWAAPASAASHTRADGTLAGDLEHAMRVQRAFPWWRMRGHVEALGRQPAVVWSIDGEQLVRFSAQGPVDAGGEAVEVADGGLLRVAHPASMTPAERERWRGVLEALGLTPPFVQLERPVFVEGEGEVWKPGDRMEIHPDVFYEVAWEDSPFSDDYIEERVLRLPGAPWYAVATHDYRDSYLGGIYGGEDGYHIESVRLVSVLDHREYGARDAVAFSEVQLALREVAEVSARLRAQAE